MSETRFTKGPWAVNPINAQVDAFPTGDPLAVCKLLWPTEARSEAETEANARLIAAAPTMFAALEQCRKALLMIQSPAIDEQLPPERAKAGHEAIEAARAALAQANPQEGK